MITGNTGWQVEWGSEIQGVPSARRHRFWLFRSPPNSAWAEEKLREIVGHQVKDHADPSLGSDESPCRVLGYDSDHFMISKISLN